MAQQQSLFDDISANADRVAELEKRRQQKRPEPAPGKGPKASKKAADCQTLLEVLRNVDSVSSLRLRELIPCSVTQRISDLRADGYKIKCEQASGSACGLYTLMNPGHHGEKYR